MRPSELSDRLHRMCTKSVATDDCPPPHVFHLQASRTALWVPSIEERESVSHVSQGDREIDGAFCDFERAQALTEGIDFYSMMEGKAEKLPPGANGYFVFSGCRAWLP